MVYVAVVMQGALEETARTAQENKLSRRKSYESLLRHTESSHVWLSLCRVLLRTWPEL